VYPLSDLPALGFMFFALYLLAGLRDVASTSTNPAPTWIDSVPWLSLLFCGAAAAAAYNVRSIYLFFALPLLLTVIWRYRRRPALVAAFCLGALLVTLPQVALNKSIHGKASANPAVGIGSGSLFAAQLSLGLKVQKAETNLPPRGPANLHYRDPDGVALIAQLGREPEIRSVRDYLKLVAAHPLHFTWLYVRHFVNGLDVRDGLVYVDTLPEQKRGVSYFNFGVLLLAGLIALQGVMRKEPDADTARWDKFLYAAMILLPVAAIVPSAVETRYFLPLHMLAYACVAMKFEWRVASSITRSQWAIHATVALLAASAFYAITQATIANLP
jgi:hypothetical protein